MKNNPLTTQTIIFDHHWRQAPMYIHKVHIENIRSIQELDWEVPEGKEAG
jgi:hypothetical protein